MWHCDCYITMNTTVLNDLPNQSLHIFNISESQHINCITTVLSNEVPALGVVNGPLKNEKSQQIPPKSRNLAQPTNGSRSLRFCVCQSYICFSIKSLNFSVSVSDFKMPVSASRRRSDLPFASPCFKANQLRQIQIEMSD